LSLNEGEASLRQEEQRRVALSNVTSLFHDRGNLKSITDLTPEQAACLASVEVVKKNLTAGGD
jgi:hypothetical protein